MPTATINEVFSLPGMSIQGVTSRSAVGGLPPQEVALPAAAAGTLSTRASDTAGTLTMDSAEHGISTGDKIDIYFAGGVTYDATVGTVDTVTVPFTLGQGYVLPDQDTVCVADVCVELDADFDGDLCELVACMSSAARGHVNFQEDDGTTLLARELLAGEPWSWASDRGLANPLTGDPVGLIVVSNGSALVATTFKFGGVYNSDE